jgi:hypothetical protein
VEGTSTGAAVEALRPVIAGPKIVVASGSVLGEQLPPGNVTSRRKVSESELLPAPPGSSGQNVAWGLVP